MAKDPVCGMYVEEKKAPVTKEVEGTKYYFCSNNCLDEFLAPEKELNKLKRQVIIGSVLTAPIVLGTEI